MKTYTVQTGDTLFLIAKKFYGDGYKYKLLAAYNGLDNPNALEVGDTLNIPPAQDLQKSGNSLSDWHTYGNGTISWRVTPQGVEIQGKGLFEKERYTRQAERIWQAYRQPILAASQKHNVPVPAIIATISTESSGKPKAYRYEPGFYNRYIKEKKPWTENPYYDEPKRISASYGLMQIMYTTAYNVGFRGKPEDLYDPATNIDICAAYIASPFQKKQHQWDPPKIACAYNAGSVRPTKKNEWGMFYHAGHLDRWIPSYNGAIEAIGSEYAPNVPEPETEIPQPAPVVEPAETPGTPLSSLQIIFPQSPGEEWKPIIIDLFKHTDSGISDPLSSTVKTAQHDPDKGYTHTIKKLAPGTYDLVFADATSSSILYDVADYEIRTQQVTLDLRKNLRAIPDDMASPVSVIFRFSQELGQVWKPMIVDVFKHAKETRELPVSYTIKLPSHGPDGGYIYEIPQIAKGTYDFVFSDARSKAVIQDIAHYVVDEDPEMIDLRRNRALYIEQEPDTEKGFGAAIMDLLQKLFSVFSGK